MSDQLYPSAVLLPGRNSSAHKTKCLVDLRARSDVPKKRKYLMSTGIGTPDRPASVIPTIPSAASRNWIHHVFILRTCATATYVCYVRIPVRSNVAYCGVRDCSFSVTVLRFWQSFLNHF